MDKPLEVTITSYRDYIEWWYDFDIGKEHVKLDGKEISIEEFNRLQND